MNASMRRFVIAVTAVSGMLLLYLLMMQPEIRWSGVAVLFVLALLAGSMTFELPITGTVGAGFAITFAGIVYGGPLGGALVGLAGAVSAKEIRDHKPLLLMLGNGAQLALAGAFAGFVYVAISGSVGSGFDQFGLLQILAPVAAASTFFMVNVTIVSTGVALRTGIHPVEAARSLGLAQHWVSLLVLALLGLVLAQLVVERSWLGVALLVMPFTMARRTFLVYVDLTEAYTSTVRSLVAAIEAKDPYTKGHSERVADYAHRLAEHMGLSKNEVDLIERAALLHDVGKIGISLDTLVSPEALTSDEVNAIRQHPALGSDLIADVEFLSDIVDIVRHHHERCDGAGYPDGLVGGRIAVPARILAVADAYDAMTSDRAYRPRMTHAQAQDELLRVADTQLDGNIVRRFTQMLTHDQNEQVSA